MVELVCGQRIDYKSRMFTLKRSVVAATLAGVSLAVMAGCKTTKPQAAKPAPIPVTTPLVAHVETNKLTLPAHPTAPPDSSDSMEPNILTWDAVSKEYHARAGEKIAPFSFSFTNVSPRQVVIYDTKTSCDCTAAPLPSHPWMIPSGGAGKIDATIDLSNKIGVVTNYVIVFTSQGNRRLNVTAILPDRK
jgi:hypothetical protein